MSTPRRTRSTIVGCHLTGHAKQQSPMFDVRDDGTVVVDLVDYAIVPKELYTYLHALAERHDPHGLLEVSRKSTGDPLDRPHWFSADDSGDGR